MVVGPFRPAMRSGSVADSGAAVSSSEAAAEEAASDTAVLETAELALPPQAARLSARLNASSKDRIFFMIYSFSHPAHPGTGSGNRSFLKNFAKSFALRVPVYYNRGKNTVACATQLQEAAENVVFSAELR